MQFGDAIRCRTGRVMTGIAAAAALSAQAPSPQAPNDIVVNGKRLSDEQARRQAASYVRGTGVVSGERAAARWIDPVCPRVLGIEAKLARHVEQRVRAAATAAGAPLAPEPCKPNALVSFVSNGADIARRIANRQPRQFSALTPPERAAMLGADMPVRWWYSTEVRGRDGDRLLGMEPVFVKGDGGTPGAVLPGNGDTDFLALYGNSIVSTMVVRAIRSATVLVDVDKATGVRLDAAADYAAFVALAELRPTSAPQPNSILDLFKGEAPPTRLTEWDEKFLRHLYRMPLDRRALRQRNALAAALIDDRPQR
ncbi:MAG TPA: hypothetical protein DEP91_07090 [Sphingomonas bacterium]|jgi:hypothetical protein|uniref:Uncharacterized protein n=1 Tax=Sphingomonas bacterium TaxID=1895847 RepID=A0A3D0WB22_9SPHN|nr:hypothetical protein [Sphingomonas bacterium]